MLVLAAALAAIPPVEGQPSRRASVASTAVASELTHRIPLRRLGYPDGVPLEGGTAAATLDFPLPPGARITHGVLSVKMEVTKAAMPGSNIQVLVNGKRRVIVPRTSDSPSPVELRVPLEASDLQDGVVHVAVRSYLTLGHDRCADEQLGSAYATVLPDTYLDFAFDPASVQGPAALWSLLGDTVRVGVPSRALTPAEFAVAYDLAFALRADNRDVELVRDGQRDLSIDSVSLLRRIVLWRQLATHQRRPISNDPTLQELGAGDLGRLYGYRTAWHIPIDLRAFPANRVPASIDLAMLSAPSTMARGVQFFVYMNGTLLRAFTTPERDDAQQYRVELPQYLLSTYNEVRVEVQRHRDPAAYCEQAEALYPAQILDTSRVHTVLATNEPTLFTGAALRLPDTMAVYLPQRALTESEAYLPLTVALARGLWGNKSPRFSFYVPTEKVEPTDRFVMVGLPAGIKLDSPVSEDSGRIVIHGPAVGTADLGARDAGTMFVQVARLNGHTGIVATAPAPLHAAQLSDRPESYSNMDVVIQSAITSPLTLNTRGPAVDMLYDDYTWLHRHAWTPELILGIAALVLFLAAIIYVAWRKQVRRRRAEKAAVESVRAVRDSVAVSAITLKDE